MIFLRRDRPPVRRLVAVRVGLFFLGAGIWLAGVMGRDRERLDENLALIRKAYELDPRNAFVVGRYASHLRDFGGDPEEAAVAGLDPLPVVAWPEIHGDQDGDNQVEDDR